MGSFWNVEPVQVFETFFQRRTTPEALVGAMQDSSLQRYGSCSPGMRTHQKYATPALDNIQLPWRILHNEFMVTKHDVEALYVRPMCGFGKTA